MLRSVVPVRSLSLTTLRARLVSAFGPMRPHQHRLDPMSQLVRTLVGARTYDETAWAAFVRLAGAVRDWRALGRIPASQIEPIIAKVTWADSKARQLRLAVKVIQARRGDLDLSFLAKLPVEEARLWLRGVPGVDGRCAAAVLNLSTLACRDFVVDSHVLRVVGRLGLISRAATRDEAHAAMMSVLPDAWSADDLNELHWLLRTLGQTLCTGQAPACNVCPLAADCHRAGVGDTGSVLAFRPRPAPNQA